MLIRFPEHQQEFTFPTIGVTFATSWKDQTIVCHRIEAPTEIASLPERTDTTDLPPKVLDLAIHSANHDLRNRLNAMSLCLHILKEYYRVQRPMQPRILSRAIIECHTMDEILSCKRQPNPFMTALSDQQLFPLVLMQIADTLDQQRLAYELRSRGIQIAMSEDVQAALIQLTKLTRTPDVALLDPSSIHQSEGKLFQPTQRPFDSHSTQLIVTSAGRAANRLRCDDGELSQLTHQVLAALGAADMPRFRVSTRK